MGRKDVRVNILKRAIAEVGRSNGFTHKLWYKVSNDEIWNWILDNHYDRMFSKLRVKAMRKTLPVMYREKIQSDRTSRK